MSNDAPPPVPSPSAAGSATAAPAMTPVAPAPVAPKGGSGFGWAATIIGLFVGLGLIVAKIYSVVTTDYAFDDTDLTGLTLTIGALGILSIVLIITAIILGHIGIAKAGKAGGRGAGISGFALGGAYLLLVLWIVRLVSATISAVIYNDWGYFLQDTVWWA